MHLFIFNYTQQYGERLLTYLQGKQQRRGVVWIINWALQIHCNLKVSVSADKFVSKEWMKKDCRGGLQKIYVIWYCFFVLSKTLDIWNLNNFLPLDHVPPKMKIICFWFQTVKNDWVWRNVFERFITILNVSVYVTRDLFLQLVSILEKLDSKFESFFTE